MICCLHYFMICDLTMYDLQFYDLHDDLSIYDLQITIYDLWFTIYGLSICDLRFNKLTNQFAQTLIHMHQSNSICVDPIRYV